MFKMAERLYFMSTCDKYVFKELVGEFTYYSGFALSQKQKSIDSLHQTIKNIHNTNKILEVSSKSQNELGVKLSAFNLMLGNYHLENIFQSSKKFENGCQYTDLLNVPPKDAKRDERLKNSGRLKCFVYNGIEYPLIPQSLFYDFIYINALLTHEDLYKEIVNYDFFTDIEFNHKKSINCQARSASIASSLLRIYNSDTEKIISELYDILKKILYYNHLPKIKGEN